MTDEKRKQELYTKKVWLFVKLLRNSSQEEILSLMLKYFGDKSLEVALKVVLVKND